MQMFWGAAFCLPSGFSFTALRFSTLVLGLIGVLTTYGLFLEIGASDGVALFGALSFGFNPLYLVLSYTFMTDVPFVTFCLLSLYFLLRAMRTNSNREMAVGLLFACIALLTRQNGLAIFIAAGLALLAKERLRARTALIAVIPILLGVATQLLFQGWLNSTHRLPVVYQLQVRWILNICSHMSWRSIVAFADAYVVFMVYLGLFSFPFLMFLGPHKLISLFHSRSMTFVTVLFAAFAVHFLRHGKMPLLPNVLYDLGLGPAILYDTDTLQLHHLPKAGDAFWTVMTFAGLVGAIFLFQAALVAIAEIFSRGEYAPVRIRRQAMVLFLATGMIYIAPMVVLWSRQLVFDRYLLLLVPLATLLLVQSSATHELAETGYRFSVPAVVTLALFGVFSVAGTHDYLSWNRVRWQALNNLMQEQHVSPKQMDGGVEFNAWYLYSRSYPNPLLSVDIDWNKKPESMERKPAPTKSWWWVASDDYVVTFGPVPGFTELKCYQFQRWLPPGEASILILHKTSAGASR